LLTEKGEDMAELKMEIIAPDTHKHGDEIVDLISKVFSGGINYFAFRDTWGNRIYHGNYDWETSRIGIIDGKIITHWGVWGHEMRIGSSIVRVGGIGVVATDFDFRKKGLMAKTANASIEAMRPAGYDMTILFGIDDFYHKFGYTRAWAETSYIVKTSDLPKEKPILPIHKFPVKQRDDLNELYNHENANFTGTAVKPTYIRNPFLPKTEGYLWKNKQGKPSGYVITWEWDGRIYINEPVGDVEQILRCVGMVVRKREYKEARFVGMHYDSGLCKTLRRRTCRAETSYKKCGEAMIRTLNLESTLRKISGELSNRLKNSCCADWNGVLLISDSREKACLKIVRDKVSVISQIETKHSIRGGDEIAQLLIGTDESEEVIEAGKIKLTGDAKSLMKILFPNQHPNLGAWDRY
jgi:predicted N-acetyltransferase YhbS